MKTTTAKQSAQMNKGRYSDLKLMLEDRRREILNEVQEKMRDQRDDTIWGKVNEVLDAGESSEVDIQEDIEFALIQMKAETLTKINEALGRLEEGTYGYCSECGGEVSEQRLRALPFAVRCKECEEAREVAAEREKVAAQRRNGPQFFLDMSS
jgi:DnaK suppressor protein